MDLDRWHEEDRGFETPCRIWEGGTSKGYPVQSRRPRRVHRAVFEKHHGIKLPSSVHVHHRCEVKLCIHPDHLEAKTRPEHGAAHTGYAGVTPRTGPITTAHDGSTSTIPWRARRAAQSTQEA